MLKYLFLNFILVAMTPVVAATLNCQISDKTSLVYSAKIESVLNEKSLIGRKNFVTAYVTEKKQNVFLVEAYLANEDLRIYGQGKIENSLESVIASIWSRDSLIDISCSKP